jgi:hypothetical protein
MTVEENFLTKAKFSKLVESTVIEKRLSYMDAIVWLCEEHNIEIEDVRKFINPIIKDKLEAEARRLNFLPRQNTLDSVMV